MSFKRPRPLSYGVHHGQQIVQNGIAQESPLDRKSLPLEQQKKFIVAISSDDREAPSDGKGDDVLPTDCVINLKTPLKGVYGYRVLEFNFTNRFFSVQTGLNDLLRVTWTVPPVADGVNLTAAIVEGKIVLSEGYYEFTSVPSDFVNPLWPSGDPPPNLNILNYGTLTNYVLYFPLDVRVRLLVAAGGTIESIVTDRLTDTLTITWAAGLKPTVNSSLSNSLSVLGLSRNSTTNAANEWKTIGPPNVDGPANLALLSNVLNNDELIDPKGQNDYFVTVPIKSLIDEREVYRPFFPPFVNLNSQVNINRIPIKVVEPESGQVLKGNNMEWDLTLECFSLDPNPFY